MTEWMLANVICHEFEKNIGKNQGESGKAMHIGFGVRPTKKSDQYHVIHMYIFAPMNYVYVVTQTERITAAGKRVVGPMEILSYHDSCWSSAVQDFIYAHRGDLNVFRCFRLLEWCDAIEWYDAIVLTAEEMKYLDDSEQWRRNSHMRTKSEKVCPLPNPFDNRGLWFGK